MIKFYIVIPTHNRNYFLNETIRSVFEQSYTHWRILISDNSSTEPIADTIPKKFMFDHRVKIVRRDDLIRTATEHIELLLRESIDVNYDYDYLLILADDDLLLPFALEIIVKYCDKNSFIACSYVSYYQKSGIISYDDSVRNDSDHSFEVDGFDLINYYIEKVGIKTNNRLKKKSKKDLVGPTHMSTYFISKKLLNRAYEKYKTILVVPFGDVGYGKFAVLSGSVLYITLPIAIIRFNDNYGMRGSLSGQRHSIAKHHDLKFEYSPLKGITFENCSLESYFRLLNDLNIDYEEEIDIKFFLLHLYEILRDTPYNKTTLNDLKEVLPYLLSLSSIFETFFSVLKYFYKKNIINKKPVVKKVEIDTIRDAIDFCVKEFENNNYGEKVD